MLTILADVRHTKSVEYDSGSGFPGCEPFDKKVYCCHSDNEMYLGLVPLCCSGGVRGWRAVGPIKVQ